VKGINQEPFEKRSKENRPAIFGKRKGRRGCFYRGKKTSTLHGGVTKKKRKKKVGFLQWHGGGNGALKEGFRQGEGKGSGSLRGGGGRVNLLEIVERGRGDLKPWIQKEGGIERGKVELYTGGREKKAVRTLPVVGKREH